MKTTAKTAKKNTSKSEEKNKKADQKKMGNAGITGITGDAVEDDGSPVLDEEDLEENNLDEDEAEDIQWEPPKGK
jgi:hypothetical protein